MSTPTITLNDETRTLLRRLLSDLQEAHHLFDEAKCKVSRLNKKAKALRPTNGGPLAPGVTWSDYAACKSECVEAERNFLKCLDKKTEASLAITKAIG